MKTTLIFIFFAGVFLLALVAGATLFSQWLDSMNLWEKSARENIQISSFAFSEGKLIPFRYTCDGQNINPPLSIMDVPVGTKSLVLVVDDPDVSWGVLSNWLVWNVDPSTTHIQENALPEGAVVGTNDFYSAGYNGPCASAGTHRYFFKVFALDTKLNLAPGSSRDQLMQAMQGHILDQSKLSGKYKK